ncbi:hypothetical protein BASA60_010556 [Batrachochytrium salamandrivorans]|nr:hypothetical protein BASA60_010556 [Batrachochytrium salamandrivorans]
MSAWSTKENPKILVLFDVDGTLTPARKEISPELKQLLEKLRKKVVIGFVGGSDLVKQKEQLGENAVDMFDYAFSENGLTAFRKGESLPSESFLSYLGEEKYKRLANFVLRYIADLDLPKKRGTFIEFRTGMINVSPIGRNCSHAERSEFEAFDKVDGQHPTKVHQGPAGRVFLTTTWHTPLVARSRLMLFPKAGTRPTAFDMLHRTNFKKSTFLVTRLTSHPDVKGHSVKSPADTERILNELFF